MTVLSLFINLNGFASFWCINTQYEYLQLQYYLNTPLPLPLLDSERFGVKDIKGSSHSFSFQFFRARADITQTSTKPTKQDGCYAPKNEYRIGAAGHRRS